MGGERQEQMREEGQEQMEGEERDRSRIQGLYTFRD